MTILQQYQFWAGVLFVLITLGFLFYAFKTKDLTRGQHDIVQFVCALCAGAAGGFIAGAALLAINAQLGQGGTFAFQGTAGFALFGLVWWRFPKYVPQVVPGVNRNISVGQGWKLKQTIETIASEFSVVNAIEGLTEAELATTMQSRQVPAPTFEVAIDQLNGLVATPVRRFKAIAVEGGYKVRPA